MEWEQIRSRIKAQREIFNLSQFEVAERLGVSAGFYSKIESGKKKPSIVMLDRLSKTFHLTTRLYTVWRDTRRERQGQASDR